MIKILGSGCKKCETLEKNTVEAADELKLNLSIEHVRDFGEIVKYGVMSTPALVINEKVVSYCIVVCDLRSGNSSSRGNSNRKIKHGK